MGRQPHVFPGAHRFPHFRQVSLIFFRPIILAIGCRKASIGARQARVTGRSGDIPIAGI